MAMQQSVLSIFRGGSWVVTLVIDDVMENTLNDGCELLHVIFKKAYVASCARIFTNVARALHVGAANIFTNPCIAIYIYIYKCFLSEIQRLNRFHYTLCHCHICSAVLSQLPQCNC